MNETHSRYYRYKKRKKRIETSKLLLIVSISLVVVTMIFTFIAVLITRDVSPLAYLIPGVFGLCSTSFGFYYWKAKNENLQKYKQPIDTNTEGDNNGY